MGTNEQIMRGLIEYMEDKKIDDKDYGEVYQKLYSLRCTVEKYKKVYYYKDKYGVDLSNAIFRDDGGFRLDLFNGIDMYLHTYKEITNIGEIEPQQLICFSFSVGSYFLGDENIEEVNDMIDEDMKGFNPKYVDLLNSGFYYDIETGFEVYKKMNELRKKRAKIYKEKIEDKEITSLEQRLELLRKNK